jgi:hypothetical protein
MLTNHEVVGSFLLCMTPVKLPNYLDVTRVFKWQSVIIVKVDSPVRLSFLAHFLSRISEVLCPGGRG